MTITLSDTQNSLLRAAFDRSDRCLNASSAVKGAAFRKAGQKLMDLGLVRELRARTDMPVWRRDDEGRAYALKLTAGGLKAIAGSTDEGGNAKDEPSRVVLCGTAPPRTGSKFAHVICLLQREEGASLTELMAGTGWLAHTTRAAMTGLRKRSYVVAHDRSDPARGSVYRILETAEATTLENA
jgi:hypothetical protein